ncbi:MAG: FapA family protein [Firmicutes bacterium]|nr:FapA family protein [Bacillota bacterium]
MISEKELIGLLKKVIFEKGYDDLPKHAHVPKVEFEKPADGKNGLAWVREGMVFIQDPEDGKSYATITPAPGAEVYVNGVLQLERTPVSSADLIEVKLARQEFTGKYRLEYSEDRMEAYLIVEPTRILTYKLFFQEPQHDLILKTTPREELKCPVDFDNFKVILAEAKVTTGIKYSEAIKLAYNPDQNKVIVARGLPPEPPVDESVEILFPQKIEYTPILKEDGTADYHNIKNIFSVEEGSVLAVKHPGIPGKPGLNVFGEEVPPSPPRVAMVHVGKGAVYNNEEDRIYAKRTGRPVVKQAGQICFIDVEDVLIHDGDVDIKSGNLRFKGSLLMVRGSVKDSMAVQATGLIVINGIVSGARVIAKDNILINSNTINSVVNAGIAEELLKDLLACINGIEKSFQKVIEIVGILAAQERVKTAGLGYGYLVKLVIEKKMAEIPENVFKLNNLVKTAFVDLPEEVEKIIFNVSKVLADPHLIGAEEDLFRLLQGIELVRNFFNVMRVKKADLDMAGAINSQINGK